MKALARTKPLRPDGTGPVRTRSGRPGAGGGIRQREPLESQPSQAGFRTPSIAHDLIPNLILFPVQSIENSLLAALGELPSPHRTIGATIGINYLEVGTHHRTTRRRRFADWTEQSAKAETVVGRLPAKGATHHFLLDGSFVLASVIPVVLDQISSPCRLTIATLGFNLDTVDLLATMLQDGRLSGLRLAMSSYFQQADAETASYAVETLKAEGAIVAVARVHVKLQLYRPAKGSARYALETSSNLRSCNCIECGMLTNDVALYRWHDQWLTKFFNTHQILQSTLHLNRPLLPTSHHDNSQASPT